MKISKIEIKNFRLLKDVRLDLEDELSLVIGKNNCGKTSLLLLLERFLGKGAATFTYEDLNLDISRTLTDWIESPDAEQNRPEDVTIQMLIFITYDKTDDLSNVGDTILMDLDPNNSTIVLSFDYGADDAALDRIREDFNHENKRRQEAEIDSISTNDFLSREHGNISRHAEKASCLIWTKARQSLSTTQTWTKKRSSLIEFCGLRQSVHVAMFQTRSLTKHCPHSQLGNMIE